MPAPTPSVKAVFDRALDLASPAERAAYLDAACAGAPDVRLRVEALLRAYADAGSFLELPAHTTTGAHRGADPDAAPTGEHVPDGATGTFGGTTAAAPVAPGLAPGIVIAGRYTLQEKIGEGGMGEVWVAKETVPVKRRVALKVIKLGMDSRALLARFEQERQALAVMEHPNVARVLDGGLTPTGQPFFVMELVNGLPLNTFCDEARLTLRERLELFVPICRAVQHAHQKGIVHRDLKPANILVTLIDGRPVPKVIDFGVAKATGGGVTDESVATRFGTVVGTLEYMAPEQAGFSGADVDTRADVYSLGVILYELLTGSRPMDAARLRKAGLAEMIRAIQEEEPLKPSTRLSSDAARASLAALRQTDPRKLMAVLRGELDWVVMKCLEKDRTRRYATANGLARDVERYLADEVIEARPSSAGYRLRKFVRRHKGQVLGAGLVLAVLVAGVAGTTWGLVEARRQEWIARGEQSRAEGQRTRAEAGEKEAQAQAAIAVGERTRAEAGEKAATVERDRADRQAEVTRENLYYAQMHLAGQSWREHRGLGHMRGVLAGWLPAGAAPDRRGWEWFYLRSLEHQAVRPLVEVEVEVEVGARSRVTALAWHAARNRLAEGTPTGLIRVWDVGRERVARTLTGPAPRVAFWGSDWLGWSPDGAKLAAGFNDGTVRVWDADSGREQLPVLRDHTSPVVSVAYSTDGRRLAAFGTDGKITVWDAAAGRVTDRIVHPDGVSAAAWGPGDARLATGHHDGTVTVSGTRAGDPVATLPGPVATVYRVAWSPDGTRLAAAGEDFATRVWDVATRQLVLGPLRHSHGVTVAAWEPGGKRLATGGFDETVKLWDAATGRELQVFRGHIATVTGLAWGPAGRLASAANDGTVKAWDATRGQEVVTLPGHPPRATAVAWSPDGTRLASAGDDGLVRVWNPATRAEVASFKAHTDHPVNAQFGQIRSIAWSPDGTRLASAGLDGKAKVWDAAAGREVFAFPADRGMVWAVAWSPDGTRLAAGANDGSIRVATGVGPAAVLHEFKAHNGGTRGLAWSPQGDRLASAGYDGLVRVWSPTGAELVHMAGHRSGVFCVAWSPDGKQLASAGTDRFVALWDATTGARLRTMSGHNDWVDAVGWSPDGSRVVSAGIDNSVRLWDPRTGEEAFAIRGDHGMFHDVAWHPGGAQLAAAGSDGRVWVWDATPGFERDTTARAEPFIDRLIAAAPATSADRVRVARLAHAHRRFATAARLWGDALADDPALGDDRATRLRYHAARAAGMAAAGAPADSAALRRQALDWLTAETAAWRRHLAACPPRDREEVAAVLSGWARDPQLAGVCDAAARASLPADERKAFEALWADVAEVLNVARAGCAAYYRGRLPEARREHAGDRPQLAFALAQCGKAFHEAGQLVEAETVLRECLAIRVKEQPESWPTFNTYSMLGGVLLGQQKYADAEPLLLKGYHGMKAREAAIPPIGRDRLPEAIDRLVDLYAATNRPAEAARWRAERAK